jgi:putative transposase
MAAVPQFFRIDVGDHVRADGRSYRVTHVLAIDSVMAIDTETQESTRLRLETVQRLAEDEQAPIRPDLEHFSKEDWAEAQKRLAIIKPFIEAQLRTREDAIKIAQKFEIHVATFYRWVSLFESSGQTSSLVPDKRGRKRGTRLLQPEQEKVIQAAIEDKYLTKDKGTASDVVEEVEKMCRLAKLRIPNHNTIRSRVREVPKATAFRRRGRKDLARNLYEPVKGEFPGGDFPLAVVQIDHTEADIILVDEETRQPICRPWLTLALDVYSRMVVGLYITFEKPSYMSVGMCISNSICPKSDYLVSLGVTGEWPVWGKPSKLHADNAKEFRGSKLKRACQEYAIDLQWRPVQKPNYGGHIERLMGTMANEIRKIPGKTFSNIAERKGYNSEQEAVMTLREFEAYIVDFIVNKYHARKHSELGTSPLAKWKQGILGDDKKPGIGLLPVPKDPERIRLDFLPFKNRTIQTYGVRKDHIDYYDPVLDPYINAMDDETRRKRSFLFRYDPKDISVLWFLDPADNRYIPIPYRDLSRPAISEWERRKAHAMLEAEGVKDIDEDKLFEATDRLRKRIEDSKAATKAARKAATRIPGKKKSEVPSVERQVPIPEAPDKPAYAPPVRSAKPAETTGLFDEPIEPFRVVLSR